MTSAPPLDHRYAALRALAARTRWIVVCVLASCALSVAQAIAPADATLVIVADAGTIVGVGSTERGTRFDLRLQGDFQGFARMLVIGDGGLLSGVDVMVLAGVVFVAFEDLRTLAVRSGFTDVSVTAVDGGALELPPADPPARPPGSGADRPETDVPGQAPREPGEPAEPAEPGDGAVGPGAPAEPAEPSAPPPALVPERGASGEPGGPPLATPGRPDGPGGPPAATPGRPEGPPAHGRGGDDDGDEPPLDGDGDEGPERPGRGLGR